MTILELITGALRSLNVLDETETASAEQGTTCLGELNNMLEQWEEDGIKLQYYAQSSTVGTFPCPAYANAGVQAALAIRVAGKFGAHVSVELAAEFDSAFSTILRKAMNNQLPEGSMTHLPGNYRPFNILTGQ